MEPKSSDNGRISRRELVTGAVTAAGIFGLASSLGGVAQTAGASAQPASLVCSVNGPFEPGKSRKLPLGTAVGEHFVDPMDVELVKRTRRTNVRLRFLCQGPMDAARRVAVEITLSNAKGETLTTMSRLVEDQRVVAEREPVRILSGERMIPGRANIEQFRIDPRLLGEIQQVKVVFRQV